MASAPSRIGRYHLLNRLGRGGVAEVWRAEHRSLFRRRIVAVKRLLPKAAADPARIEALRNEAKLSRRLDHPNIVKVHGVERVGGEHLLAMEYVDGCDLRRVLTSWVASGELPSPGLGAFVLAKVCRALAHAHERKEPVVHLDLSPSNVMLGRDGTVRLVDFGVAKPLGVDPPEHDPGAVAGTLAYMAPEQLTGDPVDARTDLYSAGVLLYETLTARRLFKGGGDLATMIALRGGSIDPPSRSNEQVPPELDRICLRALARAPEARYPRCAKMADALEALLPGLGFGPDELARAVESVLAPGAPTRTLGRPTESMTDLEDVAAPARPRGRVYLVAGALVAAAAGGLLLFARSRAASTVTAPAAKRGPSSATHRR